MSIPHAILIGVLESQQVTTRRMSTMQHLTRDAKLKDGHRSGCAVERDVDFAVGHLIESAARTLLFRCKPNSGETERLAAGLLGYCLMHR